MKQQENAQLDQLTAEFRMLERQYQDQIRILEEEL
jgi:hypothetical protein